MSAIATRETCSHCGSSIIIADEDRQPYCLMCRRPYRDYRDYGRIGGLQTSLRHGKEHMREIGRRGGLARRLSTITELRQQPAPKAQNKVREGVAAQPNNLRVLKELFKNKIRQGGIGLQVPHLEV